MSIESTRPTLCAVLEGHKTTLAGIDDVSHGAGQHFVKEGSFAVSGWIDTPPFVSVVLELDFEMLTQLVIDQQDALPSAPPGGLPFAVGTATGPILASLGRLLALLDAPEDLQALRPGREREFLYRVLRGPCGPALYRAAYSFPAHDGIRAAVSWIRGNLSTRLDVEALAGGANMSVSSFRRHFRRETGLAPLEYQRDLRLRAARQLLMSGEYTAASAAREAGYRSPSQFSRDYRAHFGEPPAREILLRETSPKPGSAEIG